MFSVDGQTKMAYFRQTNWGWILEDDDRSDQRDKKRLGIL